MNCYTWSEKYYSHGTFPRGSGCCINHCIVQPIEKIDDSGTNKDQKRRRLEREAFWIKELRTLTPYGLNARLDSKNWRYRWRTDIAGICFNKVTHNHRSRGSRGRRLSKHVSMIHGSWMRYIHLILTWLIGVILLALQSIQSIILSYMVYSWTTVELSNDCSTNYEFSIVYD